MNEETDVTVLDPNLQKFAAMSKRLKEQRATSTPKDFIKERKGAGGKTFQHVDWVSCTRWLDEHYPGWSFDIIPEGMERTEFYYSVLGKLSIFEREGVPRTFTCYGSAEMKFKREGGEMFSQDYLKNAETDSIKRCCAKIGAFNDLYTDADLGADTRPDIDWFFETIYPVINMKNIKEEMRWNIMINITKGYLNGISTKEQLINKFIKGE